MGFIQETRGVEGLDTLATFSLKWMSKVGPKVRTHATFSVPPLCKWDLFACKFTLWISWKSGMILSSWTSTRHIFGFMACLFISWLSWKPSSAWSKADTMEWGGSQVLKYWHSIEEQYDRLCVMAQTYWCIRVTFQEDIPLEIKRELGPKTSWEK